MDKIKHFITCFVPIDTCNFNCVYCYLNDVNGNNLKIGGYRKFVQEPKQLIKGLTKKRLGGTCYFNLCGSGETMMHPQLLDFVYELTNEGHFCDIITNGVVSNEFDKLLTILKDENRKRLMIKFSFHYLELIKQEKMGVFLENVKKMKDNNISFSIEITPHDELIPYIDEIKAFSIENFGAWPHITVARTEADKSIPLLTKFSQEEYHRVWSVFDSELFDFKFKIFNQKRCEFCYAGDWSFCLDLATGIYSQCYKGDKLGNIMRNVERPLTLRAIGCCNEAHCFNGHAFLTLGSVPELIAPSYTQVRDRITVGKEHWLQPDIARFFSTKLNELNEEYSEKEKRKAVRNTLIKNKSRMIKKALKKSIKFSGKYKNE